MMFEAGDGIMDFPQRSLHFTFFFFTIAGFGGTCKNWSKAWIGMAPTQE